VRDEEDDDENRGGPGWFATLFGAALLLTAGFAVGVVVGAVREEPAMVLRYVTGKGAELPAPAAPVATSAPAPAAAAASPELAASRPAQPLVAPAAPVVPEVPVAAAPPSRAGFAVQVGAFAQSGEAEKLEAQLRRKGLPAYVQPATGARDSRWRVRVGPLATRDEADRVATRLKTQEKLPVWVLEESG
jgi:cell division septation protein DedD